MRQLTREELNNSKRTVRDNLGRIEGKKVLIIGDVGLDEYLMGDVRRISPEAPVPVVEIRNCEYRLGLAANVAQNIHSLGGIGLMVGVVGNDTAAKDFGTLLKKYGVSDQNLIVDDGRPTTHKVRLMSGQHHVVRFDFEETKFLPSSLEKSVVEKFRSLLEGSVGVVLQDYGKGVLSENLCQTLIRVTHEQNKKVVVDPHRTTPIRYYRGADVLKPNREEAYLLSGLNLDDLRDHPNSLIDVGQAIQEQTGCSHLIVTQGQNGVTLFSREKTAAHESNGATSIPTDARQVFDVTGAGDTYLAAFSLAWFSGLSLETAAIMANAAAGVVVGKIGCVPCSQEELREALE